MKIHTLKYIVMFIKVCILLCVISSHSLFTSATHPDCYNITKTYRGTQNKTITGIVCQNWNESIPHIPRKSPPDGPHNYCRDPDNSSFLWCYTTDRDTRWQECYVPKCDVDSKLLISNKDNNSSSSISSIPLSIFPKYSSKPKDNRIYEEPPFSYISAMAADETNDRLYFSDRSKSFLGILDMNTKHTTKVLHGFGSRVAAISYDRIHQNVYWTDSVMKRIMVSDFNLEYYAPVYQDEIASVYGLTIHTFKSLLIFSTSKGHMSHIKKCDLAGRNVQNVITLPRVHNVLSITIDYVDDRLYWINDNYPFDYLSFSNLNGTDMKDIHFEGMFFKNALKSITSFQNFIYVINDFGYFSLSYPNNAYYIAVLDKTGSLEFYFPYESKIEAFAIYQKQEKSTNPDDSKVSKNNKPLERCAHISLPLDSGTQKCICSLGFTKVGKTSCKREYFKDNFMILSDYALQKMFQVSLENRSAPYTVLPIDQAFDSTVTSIALSAKTKTLYWSNRDTSSIYKSNLDGSNLKVLIKHHHALSIKIDHETENIYFADDDAESIFVSDRSGLYIKRLLHLSISQDSQRIKGIALDQKNKMIYWTAVSFDGESNLISVGVIERMGFDGSNRQIILDDLLYPGAIAISHERDTLFFSSNASTVHELSLSSLPRQNKNLPKSVVSYTFKQASLEQPIEDLVVDGSFMYLTFNHSTRKYDVADPGRIVEVEDGRFYEPRFIAIYNSSQYTQTGNTTKCQKLNCSQLCLQTPNKTAVCACGIEYKMSVNSSSKCIKNVVDETPPSYGNTCPKDRTVHVLQCQQYFELPHWDPPTWKDNKTPTKDLNITKPNLRQRYPLTHSPKKERMYVFLYTATDKAGNMGFCYVLVTVIYEKCKGELELNSTEFYVSSNRCFKGSIAQDIQCADPNKLIKYESKTYEELMNLCNFPSRHWKFQNPLNFSCVLRGTPEKSPTPKHLSGAVVAAFILILLILLGGVACLVYWVKKRQGTSITSTDLIAMVWKRTTEPGTFGTSNLTYKQFR